MTSSEDRAVVIVASTAGIILCLVGGFVATSPPATRPCIFDPADPMSLCVPMTPARDITNDELLYCMHTSAFSHTPTLGCRLYGVRSDLACALYHDTDNPHCRYHPWETPSP